MSNDAPLFSKEAFSGFMLTIFFSPPSVRLLLLSQINVRIKRTEQGKKAHKTAPCQNQMLCILHSCKPNHFSHSSEPSLLKGLVNQPSCWFLWYRRAVQQHRKRFFSLSSTNKKLSHLTLGSVVCV